MSRNKDPSGRSLSEWIPLGWDWKGAKEHIISPDEWRAEINEKMDRLQAFLKEEGLRGVLLTRVRYVQWITAGLASTKIAQGRENGAGSLLIMDDGSKYLICDGSEAPPCGPAIGGAGSGAGRLIK